nr:hypothetical protein CFP56_32326 [Quercus suber]
MRHCGLPRLRSRITPTLPPAIIALALAVKDLCYHGRHNASAAHSTEQTKGKSGIEDCKVQHHPLNSPCLIHLALPPRRPDLPYPLRKQKRSRLRQTSLLLIHTRGHSLAHVRPPVPIRTRHRVFPPSKQPTYRPFLSFPFPSLTLLAGSSVGMPEQADGEPVGRRSQLTNSPVAQPRPRANWRIR